MKWVILWLFGVLIVWIFMAAKSKNDAIFERDLDEIKLENSEKNEAKKS